MKPASFNYLRPKSLTEALDLLDEHADDIAVIAGGQSLVPLLNFRMARPEVILDINDLAELQDVRAENGTLHVGAMVRHRRVEQDEIFRSNIPLMSEAEESVAHIQIKTRGTLGGNLCNAHPASEMPAVMAALGASLVCRSKSRGERVLSVDEFFEGTMQNTLEADELLCEIQIPVPGLHIGWAFQEASRRHGDFALCGAAVLLGATDGKIDYARIGLCSLADTPVRFEALENWLIGKTTGDELLDETHRCALEAIDADGDATMSAENKARLASTVIARAVRRAADRITGPGQKKG